MTRWREAVEDYLATRRALGCQLKRSGRLLLGFARFLKRDRAAKLAVARALRWAQQDSSVQLATQALRLSIVRGFARYHRAIDPRTEIPPTSPLPFLPKRAQPYLYTDAEIRRLLDAALGLSPEDALRRWVYYSLIGLLAVSGLRIEEALDLRLVDVDLDTDRCPYDSPGKVWPIATRAAASVIPKVADGLSRTTQSSPGRTRGVGFLPGEQAGPTHEQLQRPLHFRCSLAPSRRKTRAAFT